MKTGSTVIFAVKETIWHLSTIDFSKSCPWWAKYFTGKNLLLYKQKLTFGFFQLFENPGCSSGALFATLARLLGVQVRWFREQFDILHCGRNCEANLQDPAYLLSTHRQSFYRLAAI